ncbi:hypothetical protein ACFLXQ_01505 [Chloroflexota bacterium]
MMDAICEFGGWRCPNPTHNHLCGGLFFPTLKRMPKYPYWFVASYFRAKPRYGAIPPVQPSFFDEWHPPIKVWGAKYLCARGAVWAEQNEKKLDAFEVKVVKIDRPSPRKVTHEVVDFSDVLNLGCQR